MATYFSLGPSWKRSLYTPGTRYLLRRSLASTTTESTTRTTKPNKPMLPSYDSKKVEEGWYDWWESRGFFTSSSADYYPTKNNNNNKEFTMITPPPNVTGSLHIGHALTFSIEDALVRWRRMKGDNVKWIPGTDHAGIGTQSVVEKMLMRDRRQTRHDLGREAFVGEVWKWRRKYGDHILQQIRRMGASVSWNDTYFTIDEPRYQAVQNAFMQMFKDGLIYRDTRLVNWCCALETVISDIEVDYIDIQGSTFLQLPGKTKGVEFGVLHQFTYPVVNPSPGGIEKLVISTTRIETMLGDCAIAVHPDDPRYKELHGKQVYHPLLKKTLPIICDEHLVDMEFGTGVVKITPAHDPNDYACAKRHNLPIVSVFDKLGKLNNNCGIEELVGQDRFDVRQTVIDRLKQLGHYQGKDDKHAMRIAVCSRSGDIIEPLLQPQWYVKCKDLAYISKHQVELGAMNIYPTHHVQEWYRWLDNIQDWCVSRQLWWGHEIPAYQIDILDDTKSTEELWVVAQDEDKANMEATALLQKKGYSSDTPYRLLKDQDVLDTWFSSALLPLSALGWKGKSNELSIPERYPLQVMETGFDILFFWVARMAMLCNHFVQSPPFQDIYLHGMVRDAQGRKMSKSLGNVIDPLHVIQGVDLDTLKSNLYSGNLPEKEIGRSIRNLEKEYPNGIPACGTDSLRYALIAYTQQTRQINLDISNVIQTSYFCNKLWNLFKFGLGRLENEDLGSNHALPAIEQLSLVDRFILSRMADTVMKCQQGFESYRLFEAADVVRRFIVEDVCDVYVEFAKTNLNNKDMNYHEKISILSTLRTCMDVSLRLAHPFMPFVTEELWQHMKERVPAMTSVDRPPSIMLEQYPSPQLFSQHYDEDIEKHFKVVLSIIHASRSLRQGHQISIGKELPFIIWCDDTKLHDPNGPLQLYLNDIKKFVKASSIEIQQQDIPSTGQWTVKVINSNLKILVPTEEIIRAQLEKAAANGSDLQSAIANKNKLLNKKLNKAKLDLEKIKEKMNKPGYDQAVPETVKEKNRKRQQMLELDLETLENDLKLMSLIKINNF
ncbi:tRNA synthetases class I-domain-containing protein [Halteromyces radiatus]|uniref:tRNA synthetases class I-domain-containing protein n=1 Tax=Halteromyces radiatus TaxID=101107 RepID=UPI0022207736|nr:tRNA synthetases class I-domain-containing protein [Halteromyces radiatus]KAI8086525.1 tRNA synthetases class I-domain-containing protein [Halteromyces radiatus]